MHRISQDKFLETNLSQVSKLYLFNKDERETCCSEKYKQKSNIIFLKDKYEDLKSSASKEMNLKLL